MDVAYDHIQEEVLASDNVENKSQEELQESNANTLNADFQEAYKAISSSPWGAKLGGFFGNVVKQGQTTYNEAQKEFADIGQEASKGLTDLRSSILTRTRAISIASPSHPTEPADAKEGEVDKSTAEAIKESEGVLARLRSEAAKRLVEIQNAEDAADAALLRFGSNLRDFLKDAVKVAPAEGGDQNSTVLFESKDASGKRVIHSTRFDAQLHVIHSSLDSFTKDSTGEEYDNWTKTFDVEKKTEDITKDLNNFEELKISMEKLVPGTVAYADFWRRYYFLRHSIETAETKRRDLLKGVTAAEEEEVGWDEDSEDEATKSTTKAKSEARPASAASSTTLHPSTPSAPDKTLLQPESRRSEDEKSRADSDASYDVVGAKSGAPSHAPGSPKESRKADDSDEEDWE